MKPSLIIPRIRSQVAALGTRVAGSAAMEGAIDTGRSMVLPCAFVVSLGDQPSENLELHAVTQQILDRFAVVVCVSNASDERGQAASEQVHNLRAALWTALLGWTPDQTVYGPITYEGMPADPEIDRARMWAQFNFATEMFIQST